MKVLAIHLVYPEGMFPARERLVACGWYYELVETPELQEEMLCADCLRAAWHLYPMENDVDIVKAVQHMIKVANLCERIDLLEADMLEGKEHCDYCHNEIKEQS